MSAPITIPVSSSRASFSAVVASSPSSSSPSSGGLYVPVHRRTGSSSSSRSSSSTRSDSEHVSHPPSTTTLSIPTPTPTYIYTRDVLLNFAHSPLARLSAETRDALRVSVPEIMTNRKQRKAMEYHNHPQHSPARVQLVPPRRTRPVSRVPERRRNVAKVVDDVSWRGRMPVLMAFPQAVSAPIAV
ncbi:hypothetical protein Hypma_002089 [Hypsizygus marmoreus]|uniref:Uncharacterized protein n=1 Tax=Hypsizygus marmoreus TaxID=39966 RepID=A0A369K2Q2_HYPMA|nr:hypothetical protein Hypma_002089 [Hypsizygus marmoreus]